jgi:hypothetical protein
MIKISVLQIVVTLLPVVNTLESLTMMIMPVLLILVAQQTVSSTKRYVVMIIMPALLMIAILILAVLM